MKLKNTSSLANHYLRLTALVFSLLVGLAGSALAQTPPSNIYALGATTVAAGGVAAGTPVLGVLNPANINTTTSIIRYYTILSGVTPNQQLVGMDVRPTTGQIFALGYESATKTAQLYTLVVVTPGVGNFPGASTATAVGSAITGLDLQDTNRANTTGTLPVIGFDFNPRVDRIRVVAPNGVNYRLNPNNGAVTVDGNLTYTNSAAVGHAPYIGAVAYTNSAVGASGTTLYDFDITSNAGLLSIQSPPNDGKLAPLPATAQNSTSAYQPVTFQTNAYLGTAGSSQYYQLPSPTTSFDLDIYYDRSSSSNIAYALQAFPNGINFTSNLYTLPLDGPNRGKAVGSNIVGGVTFYYSDIAAEVSLPKIWVGATNNTNWGDANNWVPVGVPTSADDVFIPATGIVIYTGATVASQPTVSNAQQARSVTTSLNSVVTISGGSTLTVVADYTNIDGTLQTTATSGTLTIGGEFANNSGTVQSNVAGGTLDIFATTSTSSGTVAVANGGSLGVHAPFTNTGTVNTATGSTLNLYANFINNGTVTGAGTGTVALVGTAQQQISSTATTAVTTNFQNLSVGTAGATTSSAVTITRSLNVAGPLAIGSGVAFTLLSNSSGTAFVVNTGNGAVTGAATVQRYIDVTTAPANVGMGYRHYSAPVSNTTVNDLATTGFSPVFNTAYNSSTAPGTTNPFPTVYGYNQAQFTSSPATTITTSFDKGFYSPASGDAMVPGNGYAVEINGNQLVDFVGTLTTGNVSTPLQGRSSSAADAGWQLLGNPYPSAINWDLVTSTGGLVNLRGTVYVVKSTGAYTGFYASYINNQATNGGSPYIPVGQGFFVQASTVGLSGNINFTNAQRVTTDATAPFQRATADVRPQLLLELTDGAKTIQTDIYFESGATTGLDNAYDAPAPPFIDNLVLASVSGSADIMAINGLPALTGTVTVPLRLAAATAGTYTVRVANLANLPAGYHAFLRDNAQGTTTDLTVTPSAAVSLPAGAAVAGRFTVTFTTSSALATAPAALAALTNVYPNPAHGTVTLLVPQAVRNAGSTTVQLLNTLGQVVLTRTVSADSTELPLSNLAAGIYTVRIALPAGQVTKQLVVE